MHAKLAWLPRLHGIHVHVHVQPVPCNTVPTVAGERTPEHSAPTRKDGCVHSTAVLLELLLVGGQYRHRGRGCGAVAEAWMVRTVLMVLAVLNLVSFGSTETVLERMRREKAAYEAQTDAGKKAWAAERGLGKSAQEDDLLSVIKTGDAAKVARKLDEIGSRPIDETDRMQNGVLHLAAKIVNNDAALSIARLLIQKKPPMNVRSIAHTTPAQRATTCSCCQN